MNLIELKAAWVLKFATELHRLQPTIQGVIATQIALLQYETAFDLAPSAAAEIYALEEPPDDVDPAGS